MKNEFIYDLVNKSILSELEKGVVPWKKPWRVSFPVNLMSKKEYQGFNWWLLMITQETKAYKSNLWATFNQVTQKGGRVIKGQHSTPVIYWKLLEFEKKEINPKTGKHKVDKVPLLRYYHVFNLDQTEGITIKKEDRVIENNVSADGIIKKYGKQIEIKYSGSRAFYYPKEDYIQIPSRPDFFSDAEFYATHFHEMVHSTGHTKRLNRFTNVDAFNSIFGSESYSKEELVAELGSAYLCAKVNILPKVLKNTGAYIRGWLKALKDDKTLLVSAGGKAQGAVNYILEGKKQDHGLKS